MDLSRRVQGARPAPILRADGGRRNAAIPRPPGFLVAALLYESLPVNRPHCVAATYQRDGAMRFDGNVGGGVNYEPNGLGGPSKDRAYVEPPLRISGAADRYEHRQGNDDHTQQGNLHRLMPPGERERLHHAIAGAMEGVPQEIIERQLAHFEKADPAYAEGVRQALKK